MSPFSSLYVNTLAQYLSLYNPYQSFNAIGINSSYPQATQAGGLVPFARFFPYSYPLSFNPYGGFIPTGYPPTLPYTPVYNISAGYYVAAATTLEDVSGTWAGSWVSSYLAGGVTTGDLSMTFAQADTSVTGTIAFLLNKILTFL